MERKNYFELLDLNYDCNPLPQNRSYYERAIKEWKKQRENEVGNDGKIAKDEQNLYDDMVEVLLNNSNKRKAEALALKEERTRQLENLLDILLYGQAGTPVVTKAQIHNIVTKLKLSKVTVETVYRERGFEIQNYSQTIKLNDLFLQKSVLININKKIHELQAINNPKYPWTSKVKNFYDFACYFNGGNDDDIDGYHKKRTDELRDMMEAWATQYASDMSEQGHLFADLFTAASKQVFNSEENRKKYDNSLEKEKLQDFFNLLKTAPDIFKKDSMFAENCIRIIQKQFPDYNTALAIYNQETGLNAQNSAPYEPVEPLIHLTCGKCKTPAEFRTKQDALRAKCSVCGASLYIDCPKCHNKAPSSADRCACGFRLSEMQFFEEYLQKAESALKKMDLAEANKWFENAKNAYPGHARLNDFAKELKRVTDVYNEPLKLLQKLIDGRRFYEAQKMLNAFAVSKPQLKFDAQRVLIAQELEKAKSLLPPSNMDDVNKANKFVEILQIVTDYQPAIDGLAVLRPRIPLNLQATLADSTSSDCILTWVATGDKGVKYCVVRKENGTPKNHLDGKVLASNITALTYKDTSLQTGICYIYAVFACRRDVYSDPAVYKVINFSDLDAKQLHSTAEDGACRFSWNLPANAIGVRILRSVTIIPPDEPNQKCTIVTENAKSGFEDTDVQNNTTYGYRLQCIYPYEGGIRYSRGVTLSLAPEKPPVALKEVTAKTENRLVTVEWKSQDDTNRRVRIQEVVSPRVPNGIIGEVLPIQDINSFIGNGRIFKNVMSNALEAHFEIPADAVYSLAIITIAGTKGVISDIVKVSSIEKCEIDKKKTCIENGYLRIVLKNQPKHLQRIHYIIATRTNQEKAPWATVENAKNNALQVITAEQYNRDGMIIVKNLPPSDLYLTVIGQYQLPNGTIIYSEPSKRNLSNKPKEKITYQFIWSTTGFFTKKKKCKLVVKSKAKETPQIEVVYKTDGHIPMSLQDPKVIKLHTIFATENGFKNGEYKFDFPDSTWDTIHSGTQFRLLLADDDLLQYELTASAIGTCKVP